MGQAVQGSSGHGSECGRACWCLPCHAHVLCLPCHAHDHVQPTCLQLDARLQPDQGVGGRRRNGKAAGSAQAAARVRPVRAARRLGLPAAGGQAGRMDAKAHFGRGSQKAVNTTPMRPCCPPALAAPSCRSSPARWSTAACSSAALYCPSLHAHRAVEGGGKAEGALGRAHREQAHPVLPKAMPSRAARRCEAHLECQTGCRLLPCTPICFRPGCCRQTHRPTGAAATPTTASRGGAGGGVAVAMRTAGRAARAAAAEAVTPAPRPQGAAGRHQAAWADRRSVGGQPAAQAAPERRRRGPAALAGDRSRPVCLQTLATAGRLLRSGIHTGGGRRSMADVVQRQVVASAPGHPEACFFPTHSPPQQPS